MCAFGMHYFGNASQILKSAKEIRCLHDQRRGFIINKLS